MREVRKNYIESVFKTVLNVSYIFNILLLLDYSNSNQLDNIHSYLYIPYHF